MDLSEKFHVALSLTGHPPLKRPNAYRQIGSGAWHDAYLLTLVTGELLVVRLRKTIIYGRERPYDERELREDYEPVGHYYRQANHCQSGICPTFYQPIIQRDLVCTVESFMGHGLPLESFTPAQALTLGEELGRFFRAMHAHDPDLPGFGALTWDGQGVVGREARDLPAVRAREAEALEAQWETLQAARLRFDRAAVRQRLDAYLGERAWDGEPVALTNGDITPENLILRGMRFAGLVDPVPQLHNGHRAAAFFGYCYRFLLPARSEAPRYAPHNFRANAPTLMALADGYDRAYAGDDLATQRALTLETIRWLFDGVCSDFQHLQGEMSRELYLRTGGRMAITESVNAGLRALETITV